ncbi:uncharacterized protein [Ciconia boyciana]|uniref:uncharacterized protein n=1 Tax=Ciconia boyciana TaxID=52775 RepID=UPI003B9FB8B3
MGVEVDLETPMVDIDPHGGQSAPGEPPDVGRSSSRRSRWTWRTPPRWTFIIAEVEVDLENPPTLDVHHRGGRGGPGEPPHVGRSSPRRSRWTWRTPPHWTFITAGVEVDLENSPTLDVHHHGGQGGPGDPHVGYSLSWRSRWTWRTPHIGRSSPRRSRWSWRTPHVGRSSPRRSRASIFITILLLVVSIYLLTITFLLRASIFITILLLVVSIYLLTITFLLLGASVITAVLLLRVFLLLLAFLLLLLLLLGVPALLLGRRVAAGTVGAVGRLGVATGVVEICRGRGRGARTPIGGP